MANTTTDDHPSGVWGALYLPSEKVWSADAPQPPFQLVELRDRFLDIPVAQLPAAIIHLEQVSESDMYTVDHRADMRACAVILRALLPQLTGAGHTPEYQAALEKELRKIDVVRQNQEETMWANKAEETES